MKGVAVSAAVLAVVGLAAGLPAVSLVTGWTQGGIGLFSESAAGDRIERIQSRIENKCQTNIQSDPQDQDPAEYNGQLPGVSAVQTSDTEESGTQITYKVTGPEEVRTTACEVTGVLDLEPGDGDEQNPEYSVTVACDDCGADPPKLSISASIAE